ncbi:uncharacterized conserved protein [Pseudogulbenkiania sp. NH8B]|nr:uncharacterized conserved protein [Pseudogulbenkiania sp. NH8B]
MGVFARFASGLRRIVEPVTVNRRPTMTRHALFNSLAITTIFAVFAIIARPALADDDCNVPLAAWKPIKELNLLAKSRGWNVDRIKTADGCYEVRGVDRDGRRFKAKVNPVTLEIMRMKTEDPSGHERHREHAAEGERRTQSSTPSGKAGNAASGAAPTDGVLTPGTRPQVQIR